MAHHVSPPAGKPSGPGLETADWVVFPGGELEGRRQKARCAACRRLEAAPTHMSRPVCFECYREGLRRERLLRAAAGLETASEARFQWTLPFEPVNKYRLETLKTLRATERTARRGSGGFEERRRRAQLAARHMLRMLEAGLQNQRISAAGRSRSAAAGIHAAELQFPESWLPFVVAR